MDIRELMDQIEELKKVYEKKIEAQNLEIAKLKKENEGLRNINLKGLNGSISIKGETISIELKKSNTFIQSGSLRNYKQGR